MAETLQRIRTANELIDFVAFSIRVDTTLDNFLSLNHFNHLMKLGSNVEQAQAAFVQALSDCHGAFSGTMDLTKKSTGHELHRKLAALWHDSSFNTIEQNLKLQIIRRRLNARKRDVARCERLETWISNMNMLISESTYDSKPIRDVVWPSFWFWESYFKRAQPEERYSDSWQAIFERDWCMRFLHHLNSAVHFDEPLGSLGHSIKRKVSDLRYMVKSHLVSKEDIAEIFDHQDKGYTLKHSLNFLLQDLPPNTARNKQRILNSRCRVLLGKGIISYQYLVECPVSELREILNEQNFRLLIARTLNLRQVLKLGEHPHYAQVLSHPEVEAMIANHHGLLSRALYHASRGMNGESVASAIHHDYMAARFIGLSLGAGIGYLAGIGWFALITAAVGTYLIETFYDRYFTGGSIDVYFSTQKKRSNGRSESTESVSQYSGITPLRDQANRSRKSSEQLSNFSPSIDSRSSTRMKF